MFLNISTPIRDKLNIYIMFSYFIDVILLTAHNLSNVSSVDNRIILHKLR